MLTYEPAKQADIEPLFALNRQLIEDYEDLASIDLPEVLNWVHRNIERNLPAFCRILWNGELAGYFCLKLFDGKAELDSLFVLPKFRSLGIGTAVLQKCQQEAAPLFLYVFRRNTRALALYRRLGFKIVKEVGKTRYIMEYKNQGC